MTGEPDIPSVMEDIPRAPAHAIPSPTVERAASRPHNVAQLALSGFRDRALTEARRYGHDPWVFVRELLQNARDAGARHCSWSIHEHQGKTVLRCTDDGSGMAFEHARRYLFSLYASSKGDNADDAGCFGVGFWSVLRISPRTIIVQSRPRQRERGFRVTLDGGLSAAAVDHELNMAPGTEITLELTGRDGGDTRRLRDAASQNARYLTQTGGGDAPLSITVNGEPINQPFSLPAPRVEFRGPGLRGVVGLGTRSGVELFSRGLRIRAAACIEDLASPHLPARARVRFEELPECLVPRVIVDSDRLTPMLSRSDARDDREMRRVIASVRRETKRLIEGQLSQLHPPSTLEKLVWAPWAMVEQFVARVGQRLAASPAMATLAAIALGAVLAIALAPLISAIWWPAEGTPARAAVAAAPASAGSASGGPPQRSTASNSPASQPQPLSDFGRRYRGPEVNSAHLALDAPIDGSYRPASLALHLRLLATSGRGRGRAQAEREQDGAPAEGPAYAGIDCADQDCVTLEFRVAEAQPNLVLPMPTGYRLDPQSVRWQGEARLIEVVETSEGDARLIFDAAALGKLEYAVGMASIGDRARERALEPAARALPVEMRNVVERLSHSTDIDHRLESARQWVSRRIEYSTSEQTIADHAHASARGSELLERALDIGAGDCDVQNAVLVEILRALGHPARLAIGHIGRNGRFSGLRHAWVETRDPRSGRWVVLDASPPRSIDSGHAMVSGPVAHSAEINKPATQRTRDAIALEMPDIPDRPNARPSEPLELPGPSTSRGAPRLVTPRTMPTQVDDALPPTVQVLAGHDSESGAVVPELQSRPTSGLALWLIASAAIGLGVWMARWWFGRRRTRTAMEIGADSDLEPLVRGALEQPAAFAAMPRIFERPLIPALTREHDHRRELSLSTVLEASRQGRLFVASRLHPLADELIARRAQVLDAQTRLGRTAASLSGAIDLDPWAETLSRAGVPTAVGQAVDQRLRAAEVSTGVVFCAQPSAPHRLLRLPPPRGMRPGWRSRDSGLGTLDNLVLYTIDDHLESCAILHASRPATAEFRLLRKICQVVELSPRESASSLSDCAMASILETSAAEHANSELI